MKVLAIDDSRSIAAAIAEVLGNNMDVDADYCTDPVAAVDRCGREQFDIVLVDYVMPRMNGIEVMEALRSSDAYKLVPIIMITSDIDSKLRLQAIEAGATDFLNKPFDWIELQARVRNLLDLRRAQLNLADRARLLASKVDEATRHLVEREEELIWRLARAIEYRDGTTGEHISRVATISRLIAQALGFDVARARTIYLAAPLHDIGKIGVSDLILQKPGRLSADEMNTMRRHVGIGCHILENGSSDLIRVAELIAGAHHERWDGTGYPNRLAGAAIPIEGRIVAVADVFDALCSERPYKEAWPLDKARAEIHACAGTHFDPACVEAFERQWPAIETIMQGSLLLADAQSVAA